MYTLFFEGDVVQPEAAGMNPYELKRKWGDKISFLGRPGQPERHSVRRARGDQGRGAPAEG